MSIPAGLPSTVKAVGADALYNFRQPGGNAVSAAGGGGGAAPPSLVTRRNQYGRLPTEAPARNVSGVLFCSLDLASNPGMWSIPVGLPAEH